MARHTRDIILTVYTYSLQGPEPVLREQAGFLRNGYDVVAHGGVGDEHDGRGDEQRADGARSVGRAGPGRARRGAGADAQVAHEAVVGVLEGVAVDEHRGAGGEHDPLDHGHVRAVHHQRVVPVAGLEVGARRRRRADEADGQAVPVDGMPRRALHVVLDDLCGHQAVSWVSGCLRFPRGVRPRRAARRPGARRSARTRRRSSCSRARRARASGARPRARRR